MILLVVQSLSFIVGKNINKIINQYFMYSSNGTQILPDVNDIINYELNIIQRMLYHLLVATIKKCTFCIYV